MDTVTVYSYGGYTRQWLCLCSESCTCICLKTAWCLALDNKLLNRICHCCWGLLYLGNTDMHRQINNSTYTQEIFIWLSVSLRLSSTGRCIVRFVEFYGHELIESSYLTFYLVWGIWGLHGEDSIHCIWLTIASAKKFKVLGFSSKFCSNVWWISFQSLSAILFKLFVFDPDPVDWTFRLFFSSLLNNTPYLTSIHFSIIHLYRHTIVQMGMIRITNCNWNYYS